MKDSQNIETPTTFNPLKKIKTKHKMDIKPKVGEEYKCFEDCKLSPGRMYTVKVLEVLTYTEMKGKYNDQLLIWKDFTKDSPDILSLETDFFIKTTTSDNFVQFFARTPLGGWKSYDDGINLLDVKGNQTDYITYHFWD